MKIADLDFYLLDPPRTTPTRPSARCWCGWPRPAARKGGAKRSRLARQRVARAPRASAVGVGRPQRRRHRRAALDRGAGAAGAACRGRDGLLGLDRPRGAAAALSNLGGRISTARAAGDSLAGRLGRTHRATIARSGRAVFTRKCSPRPAS